MNCSSFRRGVASLLAICQIMLSCFMLGLSPTYAQTADTEPPVISLDGVDAEAARSDSQIFTVTATDNEAIDSLVFLYRLDSESEFTRAPMSRIGDTDRFTFTIPAEDMAPTASAIQYYIEARDEAGNRSLQGFSFDPLERLLIDTLTPAVSESATGDTGSGSLLGSLSTSQKVVIGVAGLVVIGALVSAAGGSSSGGDAGGETVDVTIVSQPLIPVR